MEINVNNNLNVNQEVVQSQNYYVNEVENFKNFIKKLEESINETLFKNLDNVKYSKQNSKKIVLEYKERIINFLNSIKGFNILKLEYPAFLEIENLLTDIKTQKIPEINKNLKDYKDRSMLCFVEMDEYILKQLRSLCEDFEYLISSYKNYLEDFYKKERKQKKQTELKNMKKKEPFNIISNNIISYSNEKSKIKREESLNSLNKIKTDDIRLNNEESLLKNAEIFKKKPILINMLEDTGIIEREKVNHYRFAFYDNGKDISIMKKLNNLEARVDLLNKVNKKKIKEFREKLEKNFISYEDRNKQLSEDDILNYFSDFKIKIEKYDDAIKYLNSLRFETVKELELFEKNFRKEKNKNNINLKIVLIYLKTELKELLKKDAQNLEKLVNYFYDNYTFFRKNEKYDKELLRIKEELLNVYLKFAINSYKVFLYGLDKNKSNLNLNKAYKVEDKNKRKEKDIFEKIDKKLKEKKEYFKDFISITGSDSRFF